MKDINIFITKSTEFVKNVMQRVLHNEYISSVNLRKKDVNIAFSHEIPLAKAEKENTNIAHILQNSTQCGEY